MISIQILDYKTSVWFKFFFLPKYFFHRQNANKLHELRKKLYASGISSLYVALTILLKRRLSYQLTSLKLK